MTPPNYQMFQRKYRPSPDHAGFTSGPRRDHATRPQLVGMERRMTRAPQIFGAVMMLLGALIYFLEMFDVGRNLHMFTIPAIIFMGVGAIFSFAGRVTSDERARSERPFVRTP
jgi:hypothetical protein